MQIITVLLLTKLICKQNSKLLIYPAEYLKNLYQKENKLTSISLYF